MASSGVLTSAWLGLFVVALVGCKAHGTFTCASNGQCGPGARCESNHYCSFSDTKCTSGWRYDEYAGGGLGSVCVGDAPTDAGVDGAQDAPVDAMQAPGCPVGYIVLSGQSGGYRYVSASDDWLAAELDCEDDGSGTHLVVISSSGENNAVEGLPMGETEIWVGASDRVTEGMYRTVVDTAQTYLPWEVPNPTGAGENCIFVKENNFEDDDCSQLHDYVCECDGVAPVPSSY